MIERTCACRYLNSCAHCTVLTVEQASERTGRQVATIRQWIRTHGVRSWTNQTVTYVIEGEVMACERARRHATRDARSLTTL